MVKATVIAIRRIWVDNNAMATGMMQEKNAEVTIE
jgi:hypothetical protein